MKNSIISIVTAATIAASSLYAGELKENQIKVQKGWKLLGTSYDIKDMDLIFEKKSISTIWAYDDEIKKWKVYSPDSDIRQQIMGSEIVAPLFDLKRNTGFWVLGNSFDILELNATKNDEMAPPPTIDNDTTTVDSSCKSYNCFKDSLQDVTEELLKGKTFKFLVNDWQSDNKYVSITFDNDLNTTADYENAPSWFSGSSLTVKYNSRNKTLDVSNGYDSSVSSYKVLASDSNGIVFGSVDIDSYYWNELNLYDNKFMVAIAKDISSLNASMDSMIPYKSFSSWDTESNWRVYENGYVTYYSMWDGYESNYQGEAYTLNNGKISITNEYSDNYDDNFYVGTNIRDLYVQYSIGRYRIENINEVGKNSSDQLYYGYDDNTYENKILKLDKAHDTWQKIFTATSNMIWQEEYRYDDGSTTSGKIYYSYDSSTDNNNSYATFSISDNGKTLTVDWDYDNEYDDTWSRTIETIDGHVVVTDVWTNIHNEITSDEAMMVNNPNYTGTAYRKMAKPKAAKTFDEAFRARIGKMKRK
jgi:hypothetical protein